MMTDTDSGIHRRPASGYPIDGLAEAADHIGGVRRKDLEPGDRVIVSTKNSIYSLTACPSGEFLVSGGWFERQGQGPVRAEVVGCTIGGKALFTEHVAAPGLFLEFGDGLQTTRIRSVRLVSRDHSSPNR